MHLCCRTCSKTRLPRTVCIQRARVTNPLQVKALRALVCACDMCSHINSVLGFRRTPASAYSHLAAAPFSRGKEWERGGSLYSRLLSDLLGFVIEQEAERCHWTLCTKVSQHAGLGEEHGDAAVIPDSLSICCRPSNGQFGLTFARAAGRSCTVKITAALSKCSR